MTRALTALAVAALLLAGCGSTNDDPSSPGTSGVGTAVGSEINDDAKQGGDVTYLAAADIDFMDPGQSYYTFGLMVHNATNRSLLNYKPGDDQTAVPDLAESLPEVSPDGKTITVKLRSGVRYAPPVNREVTSADVKYAIERTFTTSVPSGYAQVYFNDIVGAPEEPVKYKDREPFEGLQTPDDHTLVIKLDKPTAPQVVGALVMPITVPVPEEYAKKFDEQVPTEYDSHVAFTGPYMVRNDPKTGETVGRDPGKRIEIVRNPNWDAKTDFRPAYLDSITIEEGNTDETVVARRVLAGQSLMGTDSSGPPAAILREVLTRKQDQYGRVPSGGLHWDSFNTTAAPLDNLNVRKAIIANADRDAIRAVIGGAATGPIAQGYLPPGIPGYEESGGVEGFTDLDWMSADKGDPAIARKYMDLAEDDGVPISDGKYTGDESIEMVTNNTPDGLKSAEVAAQGMRELGFEVNIRQVPTDTLYTKFCGVPRNLPDMCISVGWLKDFADPQTMLVPPFSGDSIQPSGNVNWSLLDDDEIDAAMVEAAKLPIGEERNKAFADVNRMIVEQAPALPTTWDDNFQLQSANVAGVMNAASTSWDLSFSSLK
jgi:peptide/nickel transport system substrate-binding protein